MCIYTHITEELCGCECMDILYSLKLAGSSFAVIFVLRWAWRLLNWVLLKPKEVEKRLRQQGFKGNSYKIFFGDLKEMKKMREDALSQPINFSHDMTWPRVMPFIHNTISNYGENCFAWFGTKPAVVITDPELIKEVLSKNYIFQKPPINGVTILAKGIASYETDKWAKHRRLLNPAFHLDKLKHMLPAFQLTASEMLSKWEKIVSPNGSEIDVWPHLQTLTSDAISRTAFGSSYEEGKQIFALQKEQIQLILQASLTVFIPGWRFLPTKWNKRMKQLFNEVRKQVLGIIDKRMRMIEAGEASDDDLLGILLAENLKEIQQNGNKNFGMHIDEVIEECKLFYFAGQETTAALLVWTMILLCKHPNWQDRAREEVLRVFGSNQLLDYDALNQLKVVTMILNEVLRLYPGAYMMNRMVPRDTKLGNLCLPAGVQLLLPTMLLHHDTKIWGDDAMEFNPERFSEGVAKATKGQLVFFPFSSGPRICIGQNFAMLEAKMAIAMILKNYAFELSPSYAHAPHPLMLQPQYGAQLILHKL